MQMSSICCRKLAPAPRARWAYRGEFPGFRYAPPRALCRRLLRRLKTGWAMRERLRKDRLTKPYLWLIRVIGVIVPRRLRADWRQEWKAELRYREKLLADWDNLNWKTKLDLLWHSAGALMDALWLQPRRLEDEMFQDLRYGARMLLKSKGFTAVAALSLALGIGANTAIFSLLDTALLKMLPVKNPQELVLFKWLSGDKRMFRSHDGSGIERDEATGMRTGTSFSYPAFEQFRDQNRT